MRWTKLLCESQADGVDSVFSAGVRGRFRPSPGGPPAHAVLGQQKNWRAQGSDWGYILQACRALTKALL